MIKILLVLNVKCLLNETVYTISEKREYCRYVEARQRYTQCSMLSFFLISSNPTLM